MYSQQQMNPYAPLMSSQVQSKAPQLQPLSTPNVAMQNQAGLTETLGQAVGGKAADALVTKSGAAYTSGAAKAEALGAGKGGQMFSGAMGGLGAALPMLAPLAIGYALTK